MEEVRKARQDLLKDTKGRYTPDRHEEAPVILTCSKEKLFDNALDFGEKEKKEFNALMTGSEKGKYEPINDEFYAKSVDIRLDIVTSIAKIFNGGVQFKMGDVMIKESIAACLDENRNELCGFLTHTTAIGRYSNAPFDVTFGWSAIKQATEFYAQVRPTEQHRFVLSTFDPTGVFDVLSIPKGIQDKNSSMYKTQEFCRRQDGFIRMKPPMIVFESKPEVNVQYRMFGNMTENSFLQTIFKSGRLKHMSLKRSTLRDVFITPEDTVMGCCLKHLTARFVCFDNDILWKQRAFNKNNIEDSETADCAITTDNTPSVLIFSEREKLRAMNGLMDSARKVEKAKFKFSTSTVWLHNSSSEWQYNNQTNVLTNTSTGQQLDGNMKYAFTVCLNVGMICVREKPDHKKAAIMRGAGCGVYSCDVWARDYVNENGTVTISKKRRPVKMSIHTMTKYKIEERAIKNIEAKEKEIQAMEERSKTRTGGKRKKGSPMVMDPPECASGPKISSMDTN